MAEGGLCFVLRQNTNQTREIAYVLSTWALLATRHTCAVSLGVCVHVSLAGIGVHPQQHQHPGLDRLEPPPGVAASQRNDDAELHCERHGARMDVGQALQEPDRRHGAHSRAHLDYARS